MHIPANIIFINLFGYPHCMVIAVLPFSLLGFGFLLGIKHAFDADHVVAVLTMASRHKSIKKSSLLGMFWGLGHLISLLLTGLMAMLFKIQIPQKVSLLLEFIVGCMLILLGINVILTIKKNKIHFHKHRHGKREHAHFHSHELAKNHAHKHKIFSQSLFIGIIHGLSGSAILMLFILAAIKSLWLGLLYITIFGIGSVFGMTLISSIISLPFTLISNKLEKLQNIMSLSAGLISILIGSVFIYKYL